MKKIFLYIKKNYSWMGTVFIIGFSLGQSNWLALGGWACVLACDFLHKSSERYIKELEKDKEYWRESFYNKSKQPTNE